MPARILVLAIIAMLATSGPSAAAPEAMPPAVVISPGACPFEGCQYGRWTANEAAVLYARPDGPRIKRRIRKGEVVTALTGEVRAVPGPRAVVTNVYASDVKQGIRVGSVVRVLYPLGEGAVAVWHNSKVKNGSIDLQVRYVRPKDESWRMNYTWWAKVRLRDGTIAWLKDPGDFDGKDEFG